MEYEKAYIQQVEILPLCWFCQEKNDLNTDVEVVALLYSFLAQPHPSDPNILNKLYNLFLEN